MSLIIQNLPMPQLLVRMIENGEWFRPSQINIIRSMMKGISMNARIDFLPFSEIKSETLALKALLYEFNQAEEYGLYSSKNTQPIVLDTSLLDVEKCLTIIATINEDAILLDYRSNINNPAVVATVLIDNSYFRHNKVADSFEEFVKMAW